MAARAGTSCPDFHQECSWLLCRDAGAPSPPPPPDTAAIPPRGSCHQPGHEACPSPLRPGFPYIPCPGSPSRHHCLWRWQQAGLCEARLISGAGVGMDGTPDNIRGRLPLNQLSLPHRGYVVLILWHSRRHEAQKCIPNQTARLATSSDCGPAALLWCPQGR